MTLNRLIPIVAAALLAAAIPAAGLVQACDKAKAEATTASATAEPDKGGCAKAPAAATADLKAEGTGCAKGVAPAATTASADGKAEGKGCAKGGCSKAKSAALTAEAKPAETDAKTK